MNPQQDEIIRFLDIIQPIRVIDWADITIQKNQELGRGSFGIVNTVTIPNTTKPLAMKIIQLDECLTK